MASARRDDLARRLAERLDKAPVKGRAMSAPADDAPAPRPTARARTRPQPTKPKAPKPSTTKRAAPQRRAPEVSEPSAQRTQTTASRPSRGATGTALRGHLVPDAVHSEARRRKAGLRASRGARVTWDDVMREGVTLLVGRSGRVDDTLDAVRGAGHGAVRRRLVQATLPSDLDQRLVELQLDLSERPDLATTYEQLWSAAILLWLDAAV